MANRLNIDLSRANGDSSSQRSASGGSLDVLSVKAGEEEKVLIASHQRVLSARAKLDEKYNVDKLKAEIANSRKSAAERKKLEEQLATLEKQLTIRSAELAEKADEAYYKKANILAKKEYAQKRKLDAEEHIKKLEEEKELALLVAETGEQRLKIEDDYAKKKAALTSEAQKNAKREASIHKALRKQMTVSEKLADSKEAATKLKEKKKQLKAERALELADAKSPEEKRAIEEKYKTQIEEVEKQEKKAGKEVKRYQTLENLQKNLSSSLKYFTDGIKNAFNEVNQYMTTFYQYQSSINARLQGSTKTYQSITKRMTGNLGLSPYVSQRKYLENLNKLVDSGVAYNVEQRAFLMSISDKIATTFDASNGTLLRLIRLQQSDTTAARLGMEAYLTQFLNKMFEDTSYMNSEFYDSVSSAIMDVNATLSKEQSAEFEYTVQKWLGALGSLGLSSEAVSTIATGLNYLGTGNVTALAGNDALQTLLAMSFSRMGGGVSYVDVLKGGLNASVTNNLLKQMVMYLQEISTRGDLVTRSQYANLFNLSMSDMKAISNLSASEIENIYANTLTYAQAINETQTQMSSIRGRMHIGELISNVYENAITTAAASVANTPGTYVAWLVNDFIEKATGGINIPFISALGTGVDVNANVNQLAKLGIIGISTLGQIGTIIRSLTSGGGLDLTSWGASEFTSRGAGTGFLSGVTSGTSMSAFIGSSDAQAAYEETLTSAADSAKEAAKVMGQETEEDTRIDTIVSNTTQMSSDIQEMAKKILAAVFLMSSGDSIDESKIQQMVNNLSDSPIKVDTSSFSAFGEVLRGGSLPDL